MIGKKKINPEIRPEKYNRAAVTLRTMFEKNCRSIVISKSLGSLPNLTNISNPQDIGQDNFMYYKYIYIYIFKYVWFYSLIYLKIAKIIGHF